MSIHVQPYDRSRDFDRISRMLVDTYSAADPPPNWLRMRWEYMHYHPAIFETDTSRIGWVACEGDRLGETSDDVAGIVHYEHDPGILFLQVRPGYEHLKPALVDHAERNLHGISRLRPGWKVRGFQVPDFDRTLAALLADRGYERMPTDFDEPMSRIALDRMPDPSLPKGFRLQSLADENDLENVNRVLWRGFDHEGPPPESEIPGRAFGQRAPHFRKDLTIVAVAPDGRYAAYCGLWVEHANDHTYVEPVATDPDFRRKGLGTAAVVESLRRAASEGVDVAWVGSDQPFYKAMGFEEIFRSHRWARFFR